MSQANENNSIDNVVTDIAFDSDNIMYLLVWSSDGRVYKVTDNGNTIDKTWLVKNDVTDVSARGGFRPVSIFFDKDDNLYSIQS